ncbi:Hypothetical protein A7982_05399 [Minicystis rosea]|nr:Hypothetical protein A7982_05399 [Minicystis rosea]
MRSLAPFALTSILVACGPASPPPELPPAPTTTSVAAAPVVPAATASAAVEPPEAPSPFHPVVVNGANSLRVYPLAKGIVAINGEFLSRAMLVDARGARFEPRLYEGVEGVGEEHAFAVYSVSGDWPRSGLLSTNLPGERGGTDIDYTWNGSKWIRAKDQPLADMPETVVHMYYAGVLLGRAKWGARSLYYILDSKNDGPAFPKLVLGGKGAGKPPTVTLGSGDCPTKLAGYAHFTNLAAGDLVGVGKLCTGAGDYTHMAEVGPGALAVEHWPRGATKSTVRELPGSAGKGTLMHGQAHIHEISATDLYVRATFTGEGDVPTPYVAHWDGKAWTDISPEGKTAVEGLWVDAGKVLWVRTTRALLRRKGSTWERVVPEGVDADIMLHETAPDGTQWVRFGPDLHHLEASGAWVKIALPRAPSGERMMASHISFPAGEMMIVAANEKNTDTMLLGLHKPEKVLDLNAEEGGQKETAKKVAFGRVGPPTASCKNLFVVLYKLSRVAPPDYDFPLTREALKGHTEFSGVRFAETEDSGSRFLVAFVPDLKQGQKLLALVQSKVPSARPQLLCGEPPKTNRILDIDLRTGALKK